MHAQEPSSLGMSAGQGQGQGGSNTQQSIKKKKNLEPQFSGQCGHIQKMSKDTQESKESKIQI